MKAFSDLGVFAVFLVARAAEAQLAAEHALGKAAALIRDDAAERLGTYQAAVGPFFGWQELADSTKADRLRQGYTANDPLLRSGDLRENITSAALGREAVAGVVNGAAGKDRRDLGLIATYMELGTRSAPPRQFLGPAGFVKGEAAAQMIGKAVSDSLAGAK